jgi:8-oxo-dGTP diphosphatase
MAGDVGILLLRHASAGNRKSWTGDDRLRPLDDKGLRQARELVETLRDYPIERLLSSPYERCVATVRPLATRGGLDIETREELSEGAAPEAVRRVLAELGDTSALVCTHGDVIDALIGPQQWAAKGAAWLLEPAPDGYVPTKYVSAP